MLPPNLITGRTAQLPGETAPAKPLRILAIDPANRMGWCWCDGTERRFGVVSLKDDHDTHEGLRLQRLRDWLLRFVTLTPVDVLATEDAGYGSHNPHTTSMHHEVRGIIRLVAAERSIPCLMYPIGTIKKQTTGHGFATKKQMVAAVNRFFDMKLSDDQDNEADAIAIESLCRQLGGRATVKAPGNKGARQRKARRGAEPKLFR